MGVVIKDVERLKQMIIIKGLSHRGFARRTGISQAQITNLLNGKRNPGPETAKKIAEALDMAFDDLFDIT